jgi:putative restriction endonuclease
VSGGYVDDEDYGDMLLYTGQGGRDPNTGVQVADQELARGNIGLARSQLDGRPVRVVRLGGWEGDPQTGYRYDGLFRVVDHWHQAGLHGYRIWRFRLVALETSTEGQLLDPDLPSTAPRAQTTIQRLVRNTRLSAQVKQMYDYTCQVCGLRLETPAGPYAEGAHIRALGRPHDGPDDLANLLCLCPNHHVLFDAGAIYVDEYMVVQAAGQPIGTLKVRPEHQLDPGHFAYHASRHA